MDDNTRIIIVNKSMLSLNTGPARVTPSTAFNTFHMLSARSQVLSWNLDIFANQTYSYDS
jgi:hypothetical protein